MELLLAYLVPRRDLSDDVIDFMASDKQELFCDDRGLLSDSDSSMNGATEQRPTS